MYGLASTHSVPRDGPIVRWGGQWYSASAVCGLNLPAIDGRSIHSHEWAWSARKTAMGAVGVLYRWALGAVAGWVLLE